MNKRKAEDENEQSGDLEEEDEELIAPQSDSADALFGAKVSKNQIVRPKLYKNAKDHSQRLIVILEKANLEIVKVGNKFELLNCDDHSNQIRKYKKDPAFCRPDITHQCLLMLFDSPLNRAGFLQVYIHTMQNILIEINPCTRFPRTFKRFANLMVQLLHKLQIRAASGSERLLRVVKNPITSHLPVGCKRIGTSSKSTKLVKCSELVPTDDKAIAIVIGAMAHGETNTDYVEETFSISEYPLSGALACTKIVSAFEEAWNIH